MRALAMLAALLLASNPDPVAAKTDPKTAVPDADRLAAREKALRRSDTGRAAASELTAVRRWLGLAGWAGEEGREQERQRALSLAELQLALAQRLVTVARLKAEVERLEQALTRTRRAIVDDGKKLKKRGEYLNVLRSTR